MTARLSSISPEQICHRRPIAILFRATRARPLINVFSALSTYLALFWRAASDELLRHAPKRRHIYAVISHLLDAVVERLRRLRIIIRACAIYRFEAFNISRRLLYRLQARKAHATSRDMLDM